MYPQNTSIRLFRIRLYLTNMSGKMEPFIRTDCPRSRTAVTQQGNHICFCCLKIYFRGYFVHFLTDFLFLGPFNFFNGPFSTCQFLFFGGLLRNLELIDQFEDHFILSRSVLLFLQEFWVQVTEFGGRFTLLGVAKNVFLF